MIDRMATKSTFSTTHHTQHTERHTNEKKLSKQNEMQILISHTLSLTPIYCFGETKYFFSLCSSSVNEREKDWRLEIESVRETPIFTQTANTCLHASHFLLDRILFDPHTHTLNTVKSIKTIRKPRNQPGAITVQAHKHTHHTAKYSRECAPFGSIALIWFKRKERKVMDGQSFRVSVFVLVGNHEPYLFRFHKFNTKFVSASKKTEKAGKNFANGRNIAWWIRI